MPIHQYRVRVMVFNISIELGLWCLTPIHQYRVRVMVFNISIELGLWCLMPIHQYRVRVMVFNIIIELGLWCLMPIQLLKGCVGCIYTVESILTQKWEATVWHQQSCQ